MRASGRNVLCKSIGMGLTTALLMLGCARLQHPVLYPNTHLQQVGQQQAEQDIAVCREMAEAHVQSSAGREIARDTAIGGVGGAAVGAVGGAVGAATGATAGLLSGLFKKTAPSPAYKDFVDRCLRERGYEVVGWQ